MTEQLIMDIKFDPRNTPRPPIGHQVFIRKGIEAILPAIKAWAGPGCGDDESLISDLTEALENAYDNDGYNLAKYLDDEGWITDRVLVDILDDLSGHIYDARAEAVRLWVKTADLQYPWKGTRVRSGNITGIVDDVCRNMGKCYVKKDGDTTNALHIFDVEKVEVLNE